MARCLKPAVAYSKRLRRLVIRPGGIGDTILAFPAIEHLQADYTEVWVRWRCVPLVLFADRVRSIASTGLDLLELPETEPPRELIEHLRTFDSIVSWYGANRPEFRERACAIGSAGAVSRALPGHGRAIHAADFFFVKREAWGCDPEDRCDVERAAISQ